MEKLQIMNPLAQIAITRAPKPLYLVKWNLYLVKWFHFLCSRFMNSF